MHKNILDEKRQKLTSLQTLRAGFVQDVENLDREVEEEIRTATANAEVAFVISPYLNGARKRRENLLNSIAQTDVQIEHARQEVAAAYQDVRKYEMAEENRVREIEAAQAKAEDLEFNEIGLNVYRFRRDRQAS